MSSKGKRPVFMIPTEGKTEEQLADEVYEAIQKHWAATDEADEKDES